MSSSRQPCIVRDGVVTDGHRKSSRKRHGHRRHSKKHHGQGVEYSHTHSQQTRQHHSHYMSVRQHQTQTQTQTMEPSAVSMSLNLGNAHRLHGVEKTQCAISRSNSNVKRERARSQDQAAHKGMLLVFFRNMCEMGNVFA